MKQEAIYKVPSEYNDFFEIAKDILTEYKTIAVFRVSEFIFYLDTDELIKKLSRLLELEVWTSFERLFLEETKKIFSKVKHGNWVHVKQKKYERFSYLAFTAMIERAHIVKDELINSAYNEKFNAVKQEFILVFDSLIATIEKIRHKLKDKPSFDNRYELIQVVKNLNVVLLNLLYMYGMILENNFNIDLIRNITKDTNSIFTEYYPLQDINFLK